MTSTDFPVTRRGFAPPIKPHTRRAHISLKLQAAIADIIENGHELDEAARVGGITTHHLRTALNKPHVIVWLKQRREVFRAFVTAQNIHRAKQIRDAADNMPAVNAMKFIEDCGREQTNSDVSHSPRLTINIVQAPGSEPVAHPRIINGLVDNNASDGNVMATRSTDPHSPALATIPNSSRDEGRGEK